MKTLLILLALATGVWASAQFPEVPGVPEIPIDLPELPVDIPGLPDVPPVVGDIGGLASTACDYTSGIDFLGGASQYVCYGAELVTKAEELLTQFHETFTGLGENLMNDWLVQAMANIGGGLDEDVVIGAMNTLTTAMTEGPTVFREAIQGTLQNLRRQSYENDNPPPGSASYWYKQATTKHPNLAAARTASDVAESKVIETRGEAFAVQEYNRQITQQIAESEAIGQAMNNVLAPSAGGVGGGDAAKLEDAVRTSVSTRAAIQELTYGISDQMRQNVVMSGHIAEQQKLRAQQDLMTSWQLKLLGDTATAELDMKIAEERAALEIGMGNVIDEAKNAAGLLETVSAGLTNTLISDPRDLDLAGMGW